jgi:hypothetical protein
MSYIQQAYTGCLLDEHVATDSQVHHAMHAAACMMILLDAFEPGNLVDDRPIPGKAAALLERFASEKCNKWLLGTAASAILSRMKEEYDKVINQLLKSMEKPSTEALYHRIGRLRNDMPTPFELGQPSSSKWIGSVLAVVEAAESSVMELVNLRTYFDFINRNGCSDASANMIAQNIDTAMAKLELKLPAQTQGAFIPAGGVFDGYQAVSKAIATAKKHVFFIDPYGDDQLISDFVPLAAEGMPVYVLSDEHYAKPSLKPAAERWVTQWGSKRPLEVRIAPPKSLHDRLLVVDSSTAWVVGQSFKDLAKRAHSSLVRMDQESGTLKINAHIEIWKTATKLV